VVGLSRNTVERIDSISVVNKYDFFLAVSSLFGRKEVSAIHTNNRKDGIAGGCQNR
jgi:hypothetical protein